MQKHRRFTAQQKADLVRTFDSLTKGNTGARGDYMREHRLSWTRLNNWRRDPEVKDLIKRSATPPAPEAEAALPRIKLPDVIEGKKRVLTLRQKAQVLAHYDALPVGSNARGNFLRRYHLFWGMVNRWRAELAREGIPLPSVKPEPAPESVNGAKPPAKLSGRAKASPKSLLGKLSGEQILHLVRERRASQMKAYDSVLKDLEDLLND